MILYPKPDVDNTVCTQKKREKGLISTENLQRQTESFIPAAQKLNFRHKFIERLIEARKTHYVVYV